MPSTRSRHASPTRSPEPDARDPDAGRGESREFPDDSDGYHHWGWPSSGATALQVAVSGQESAPSPSQTGPGVEQGEFSPGIRAPTPDLRRCFYDGRFEITVDASGDESLAIHGG